MADLTIQAEFLLIPEAILVFTALLLLVAPRLWPRLFRDDSSLNSLVVVALTLSLVWLLFFLGRDHISWFNIPSNVDYFDHHLRVDLFTQLMKTAFVTAALMVALGSRDYMAGSKHMVEYNFLLLSATLGMFFVASALDLLTLFVGLELTSLSSYALVAHRKHKSASTEAGAKYFLIGAFSSALALYGMSLVYGAGNTLDLAELRKAIIDLDSGWGDTMFVASLFLIAGFGFKIAAVPFHAWAPDVYQGAPTPVTAFLAAASKLTGFIVLFKVFAIALIGVQSDWQVMVAVVAIATMTLGNLVAISQTSFRRMLAYSSIAQAGYILIALPVVAYQRNAQGEFDETTILVLGAALAHLIIHLFMKGGAFLTLSALSVKGYSDDIRQVKGLMWRRPGVALALAIFMFSLAGIPPLAGFWSKFWLFGAAVKAGLGSGEDWLIMLAVAGVLNSALSLFYYLRIVRYMFVPDTVTEADTHAVTDTETDAKTNIDKPSTIEAQADPISLDSYVPIAVSAFMICVALPLFFDQFFSLCQEAAETLLRM